MSPFKFVYLTGIGMFLVLSFRNSLKALNSCGSSIAQLSRPPASVAGDSSNTAIAPNKETASSSTTFAATTNEHQQQEQEKPKPLSSSSSSETTTNNLRKQQQSTPSAATTKETKVVEQKKPKEEKKDASAAAASAALDDINERDGFGGCLMMMDDNHFLVEWLAYHWYVMPLKHLIVLIDNKARTSPMEIFDRWKGRMTIEVVNWTYPGVLAPVPDHLMNQTAVRHYLGTQHKFYEDCVKTYKLRLKWNSWLTLHDADEFYATSRFAKLPKHALYAGDGVQLRNIDERGSVLHRLKQINELERAAKSNVTDCMITPRTQICLKTKGANSPESLATKSLGMQNQDFVTQWYNLGDTRKNGKNMVNLGAIEPDYFKTLDLLNNGSAHVITPGHDCPVEQKFQVYHYAGNEKQRTFKDAIDPRGGYANRLGGSVNPTEDQCKGQKVGDIKPWMKGFVDLVGEEEAKRLLANSGAVGVWQPYDAKTAKTIASSSGEGLPQLPLMKSQLSSVVSEATK